MSSWDFRKEGTNPSSGTDAVAGLKAGYQPYAEADHLQSKRNVIATNIGWVRRQNKTTDGNARTIDEPLVPAVPGSGNGNSTGYANSTYLGFPDVAQFYLANSTVDYFTSSQLSAITSNTTTKVHVVFNEPIAHGASAGSVKVLLEAVSGKATNAGYTANGTATATNSDIINANNTLVFTFTDLIDGVYKIPAQTLVNATATALDIYSLNVGGESANLVITGAVSNTLGQFTVAV
jgi:hypothetical protein